MKKLLALLLALCMIFVFTACAESNNDLKDAIDTLQNADKEDIDDVADALDKVADAGATTDMSVADLVKQLENDASFNAQLESLKAQNISAKVEARGNSMAFVYTLTIEITDAEKQSIKDNADSIKTTMQPMADSYRKMISKLDKLIIEYYDINGELILLCEL